MSNDLSSGTAGVQELIDRLKQDGVDRGNQEADSIVASARKHAMQLIDEAKREAEQIVVAAQNRADQIETHGRQALNLAVRDATLKLHETWQHEYRRRFHKLVALKMSDPSFLKQLIMALAAKTRSQLKDESVEILLSPQRAELLDQFLAETTAEMLRDGITLGLGQTQDEGLTLRLRDQQVEIELTADSVSAWLLGVMAPRFRELIG